MSLWLCKITVAFETPHTDKLEEAMASLREVWPATREEGWDAVVIDAADQAALVGEINARFKVRLKAGCSDPQLGGTAEIADTIPWPSVWRVGSNFHGAQAYVQYSPSPGAPKERWRRWYDGGTRKIEMVLQVEFRELKNVF